MRFTPTAIDGAFLLDLEPSRDERGFFARTFCQREFSARGLEAAFVQCSTSFNPKARTLRGMHYQKSPRRTAKLVRCTMGALHDVIVDLREDSPTRLKWTSYELTAENRRSLYVPPGCAHGFLTLTDSTEIFYQMSAEWAAESDAGVRWDDPAFAIAWPAKPAIISARDAGLPDHPRR